MIFLLMWPGASKWALRLTRRRLLTIVDPSSDVGREARFEETLAKGAASRISRDKSQ